jgi:hypothetical protein
MRAIYLMLPALLLAAPPARATVKAGDLLVTDYNGARVLAVDPVTGDTHVLSPRPGGENLLVRPTGIVMASFGDIFVVDETTNRLVAIDASTGEQVVVDTAPGVPVEVGDEPFGLALHETGGGYELWISARGSHEIRHLVGLVGFGISSSPISTDARWSDARGIAVHGTRLAVAVDEGQGYWTMDMDGNPIFDPFLESTTLGGTVDRSPGVPVWDVEPYTFEYLLTQYDAVFTERSLAVIPPGIPVCDLATSGVTARGTQTLIETKVFVTELEPADGTPLHCPMALATGLDGALYVTDSLSPSGGGAQLVRLGPGNPILDPQVEVVAALPDPQGAITLPVGLAVAPVDAAEPGSESAAVASSLVLAALVGGKRRQRVAQSPVDRSPTAMAAKNPQRDEGAAA